ncbi:MAG: hypothetical protein A3H69_03860 [Candidatus Sungbacteria bacterium RIFCSPLOWO2_02_FULL_47_9]|uniref:Uncharacterized protein n=1 Tax=Candidatus Sungbacteria bacterium RIFCSPHIGHO2_01_FULL_47_32 TaxID=1802264 RepID=A0A1G2K578_9BACT|nr:MAG: hypothetical protein UX72_C0017G0007 [Parcubacteria group bacterium GW2011_GWA2_47_10]OGZ93640.1 MAG: hypothetical protein A2633_04775 [Candidatus Sungbacteria bacterium RIFCSPHIGHO2_01_FULL_47_32]OHA05481.1 MAG: hypothetical protein A3A28_03235 [Candidatus Sungbacteria bacterium RIFCSPLOWO2_01_FULL_47_32]OHA09498.1 MAG: hypothetical protein A3H69_03860 [Candidatus Sungbacteria bacterium RIFCSPLOWO2_02_FULL_47_9]
MEIDKKRIFRKDPHLHSREHVLADDLSRMLDEPKKFARYLGIAYLYDETDLRSLAKRILEKIDLPAEARGRYFFACLKGLALTRQKRPSKGTPRVSLQKTKKQHGRTTPSHSKRAK